MKNYSLAVFPGDGIGHEITNPCVELMHLACERAGSLRLSTNTLAAGAQTYRQTGQALPASAIKQAREADAILLAAMGDPQIRYPNGTEITPQIELRFILGLYAGIRPVRSIPGVSVPLADKRAADIDFVLVRESIEGLFSPYAKGTLEDENALKASQLIEQAAFKAFADGRLRTCELGGDSGVMDVTKAVTDALKNIPV